MGQLLQWGRRRRCGGDTSSVQRRASAGAAVHSAVRVTKLCCRVPVRNRDLPYNCVGNPPRPAHRRAGGGRCRRRPLPAKGRCRRRRGAPALGWGCQPSTRYRCEGALVLLSTVAVANVAMRRRRCARVCGVEYRRGSESHTRRREMVRGARCAPSASASASASAAYVLTRHNSTSAAHAKITLGIQAAWIGSIVPAAPAAPVMRNSIM
jgi:hypothetical protein